MRRLCTFTVLATFSLLCGCARFVYKPAKLNEAGAEVVLLMHTDVGTECQIVGDVEARNIHGDPKYMRNKLRNDTAKLGGNVVRVDSWAARAYASGTALRCPDALAETLGQREPSVDEDETAAETPAAIAATEPQPAAAPNPAVPTQAAATAPAATAPAATASAATPSTATPSTAAPTVPDDELPPAPPPAPPTP